MKLCNKFYNNEGALTLNFSKEVEIKESGKWRGEEKEKTLEFAKLRERKQLTPYFLLRDYFLLSYLPIFFASKDIRLYPSQNLPIWNSTSSQNSKGIHFLLHYAINYNSPACLPF